MRYSKMKEKNINKDILRFLYKFYPKNEFILEEELRDEFGDNNYNFIKSYVDIKELIFSEGKGKNSKIKLTNIQRLPELINRLEQKEILKKQTNLIHNQNNLFFLLVFATLIYTLATVILATDVIVKNRSWFFIIVFTGLSIIIIHYLIKIVNYIKKR